uniref:Uncharacterized protein n=1 Tax=Sphaerodactylus townsendi TaxID=933632 RepID=A0ACB8G7L4_9SAUR
MIKWFHENTIIVKQIHLSFFSHMQIYANIIDYNPQDFVSRGQPYSFFFSSPSIQAGSTHNLGLEPRLANEIMTEMMRGCEGPETPTEACAPCQTSAENLECCNQAIPDGTGTSSDQEMQWISARSDSPLRAPSLNNQVRLDCPLETIDQECATL